MRSWPCPVSVRLAKQKFSHWGCPVNPNEAELFLLSCLANRSLTGQHPFHSWPTATQLTAGASAHHIQLVRIDALHSVPFDYVPTYLQDAVAPLSTLPGRAHLRLTDSGQYDAPRVTSLAGARAFSVARPQAWNQLPPSLRHTNCVATFNRHLKTILFTSAYGVTDN